MLQSTTTKTTEKILNIALMGCTDSGKSEVAGLFRHFHQNPNRNSYPCPTRTDRYYPRKYSPYFIATRCSRDYYVSANMAFVSFEKDENSSLLQFIDSGALSMYIKNQLGAISMANVAILIINTHFMMDSHDEYVEELKNQLIAARVNQVREFVVCVNGMDLCNYDENEFKRSIERIEPIFKEIFEKSLTDYQIIPTSIFTEDNLLCHSQQLNWYKGPTLYESLEMISQSMVFEKYSGLRFIIIKEMFISGVGKIICGKVQCGQLRKGQTVLLPLNNSSFVTRQVIDLEINHEKVEQVDSNTICGVYLGDIPHNLVRTGFIVSDELDQLKPVVSFEAEVVLRAGVKGFRVGAIPIVSCSLQHISCRINSIQEQKKVKIVTMTPIHNILFMENYTEKGGFLGRFLLRENGKIIGYGKVIHVHFN
ncbi:predicted protein [Naegleria gruberi]|uniref:Predicted protein n=1 Tax=Naegleria gruberi TaxID=5762 RepID=D2VGH6_NAEGR|nr:uncharacterized protein NAEGRDRAFT_67982 [Naegleria gruberi]EFC44066.1 predicted protein [Naegleria gruberi]|eukprot:XP_002676810.1 predicted protein [Naegleria gruberi strain NEG-M]